MQKNRCFWLVLERGAAPQRSMSVADLGLATCCQGGHVGWPRCGGKAPQAQSPSAAAGKQAAQETATRFTLGYCWQAGGVPCQAATRPARVCSRLATVGKGVARAGQVLACWHCCAGVLRHVLCWNTGVLVCCDMCWCARALVRCCAGLVCWCVVGALACC